MKRGGPLPRRTGLPRGTKSLAPGPPLTRSTPLRPTRPLGSGTPRPTPFRPQRPPRPTAAKVRAKAILAVRSDGRCEGYGCPGPVDPSHRIGAGVGGPWDAANLLALCRRHHDWLHANPAEARTRFGWRLESTDDYLTFPVWLAAHGWVLLDSTGGITPTGRRPEDGSNA